MDLEVYEREFLMSFNDSQETQPDNHKRTMSRTGWIVGIGVICLVWIIWSSMFQRVRAMVGSRSAWPMHEICFVLNGENHVLKDGPSLDYVLSRIQAGMIKSSYQVTSELDSGAWGAIRVGFADGRTEKYSAIFSPAGIVIYLPGLKEFTDEPDIVEVFFEEGMPSELRKCAETVVAKRDASIIGPKNGQVIHD